jgi:hypothetical protein
MNQCADAAWEQVGGESTTKKDGDNGGGPDGDNVFYHFDPFLKLQRKIRLL